MKIVTRTLGLLVLMLAVAGPASAFTAKKSRIILDITLAAGANSSIFVRVNEKKQSINVRGYAEDLYAVNAVTRTANSFGAEKVTVHVGRQS